MPSSRLSSASEAVCPICLRQAVPAPFFYEWNGRRRLHRCRGCTHEFVYPSVTATEMEQIFADHYFQAGGDIFDGCWEGGYDDETDNLEAEAREVLALLPDPGGRLLDIGCAGGVFLATAAAAGWEVHGIEYNTRMAESARKRGLSVVVGSATDLDCDVFDQPFDVVVLMDVLEHIARPRDVMERVNAWTAPGSTLLIRGPMNNDPYARMREAVRRILRIDKQLPGYPLDANVFSTRSLETLVSAYGFRVTAWPKMNRGFSNMLSVKAT